MEFHETFLFLITRKSAEITVNLRKFENTEVQKSGGISYRGISVNSSDNFWLIVFQRVDEGDQLHGKKIDTHLSLLFLFVSFFHWQKSRTGEKKERFVMLSRNVSWLFILNLYSTIPPLASADTRITRTLCMTLHGPSAEKDCLLLFPRECADNLRGTGDKSTS